MSAIAVTTFAASPGKEVLAQSILKEGLEFSHSYGGKGHVSALVRGGVPGTLSLVIEHADAAAQGAAIDRLNEDRNFQAYLERARGSGALTPLAAVDYVELPGLEVPHGEIAGHRVVNVTLFKVRHGKQAQSLERIKRSTALFAKHGGRMRALQAIASDPFGLTATAVYFKSFTEFGKARMAMGADPEFQAFNAEIVSEQASSDFLRTMVMRVL